MEFSFFHRYNIDMKTIIIGAGPAGMSAAIHVAKSGQQVLILEKNEKAGRKIFITGKGRCNVTNACHEDKFIANVVNNPKFLFSAIHAFPSKSTIDFFEREGTPLVIERGNRVFPKSYHAHDIIDTLVNACLISGAAFRFHTEVKEIKKEVNGFRLMTNQGILFCDYLLIATGGLSYPATGSTGDGYRFAQSLSHTIIDPVPALTGIKIREQIPTSLFQYTLRNVSLHVTDGKFHHEEFGEMTFYDGYLDGPIVITTSSLINRRKKEDVHLELDLKPALSEEVLLNRIAREVEQNAKGTVDDLLKGLLPAPFIFFFKKNVSLNYQRKLDFFSKEERLNLIKGLKHFKLIYDGLNGFDRAVVTSGGVSVLELNPKTMESKRVPNLFFAGEVMDVDAFTGGFNIQIALSTGALAGECIRQRLEDSVSERKEE